MLSSKKTTKSQIAYESIRRMILARRFLPKHGWSVRTLAAKLNMSTVPITEAIRRLQQEDIIQVSPQRGMAVRQLSSKELKDLMVVREALEVQAAYADFQLHKQLVDAAANPILAGQYDRLATLSMVAGEDAEGNLSACELARHADHVALIQAIASGDPSTADRTLREHIRSEASV